MTRTLLPLLFVFAPLLPVLAQAPQPKTEPAPGPADAGAAVYQKVLPATVWVRSDRGRGRVAMGSGSLVDRGRRLVLTNYHVVGDVPRATVFFPDFDSNKKAIPERKHYTDRANRLGIPGEVIEVDKEGDLALIRLDCVPDGAVELPLAAASPEPGQSVHSIGNPGKSDALWVYTPGKVRQVYSKKWKAKLDEKTVHEFQGKVIETDSPTNPGDSGGPLVNDKGELVGVTQGGAIDAQLLSLFVDLSEVKRLLNRRSVQALRSTEASATTAVQAKEPPKPHREAALKSKDDGKFFSAETMKRVQAAADKLLKEKGIDLLIETVQTPPKADADKLKAMTPEEREKFFKEYALERCKAEKINGVYVIVSRNPGFVWVEITGPAYSTFPEGTASRFTQTLHKAFKERKFDAGLMEGIQQILEVQGLAEKKDEKKEEKK
jgi:V8-like Glu-specific endopeptidase